MLNIVLLEPEIPANTGNIGRTCVAAGARLHLIEPMGFQINEKQVRRAGLDYWDKLDYRIYDSYRDFVEKNPGIKIYMATTKARHVYSEVSFEDDCYIMFGKEERRNPGRTFGRESGKHDSNSDVWRDSILESWQFCSDCFIRSIAPAWI